MIPLLLADALDLAVSRSEGAPAVAYDQRTLQYGELHALATALGLALERRGVGPGARVATLLEGVDEVVAFWAIAKAGAVGVPFDASDVDDLAAALRAADAHALLVDATVAPTFHHAVARSPQLSVVIVRGADASIETAGSAAYVPMESALAEEDPLSRASPRRIDLDPMWLERDEDDGRCALSHRVLLARGASLVRTLGIESADSVGGVSLSEVTVAAALAGACVQLYDAAPPREGGRSLWITDDEEDEPPVEEMGLVVLYASVAHGPVAVLSDGNDPAHVLDNVEVRIVDDEGKPVPAKVVGEIAVRSSSVVPSAVSDAPDGYVRMGDSGMLDEAGALYVL